jgi:hypothetical protein
VQRKWASWLTVANVPADCLLICQCPKKDLRLAAPMISIIQALNLLLTVVAAIVAPLSKSPLKI